MSLNTNSLNNTLKKISSLDIFLGTLSILILTRLLAAPLHAHSDEYMLDGILDSCSKTWQFITGQNIGGGDNCYLSFFIFFITSYFFGYSSNTLQLISIFLSSTAISLITVSINRIAGVASSLIFAGLVTTSIGFIGHGILPTNMPTALYGLSLSFFSITMLPSKKRNSLLALSLGLVLFGYAAGVISSLSLIFFHFLVFREKWPLRSALNFALLSSIVLTLVSCARKVLSGNGDLRYWAVGKIEYVDKDQYFASINTMLKDIFIKAESWYALSLNTPYLSPTLTIWLILTLLMLAFRIIIPIKNLDSIKKHSWCSIFLASFLLSLTIAAINPILPGIRRIYPSILFIFASISLLPHLLPKYTKVQIITYLAISLTIGLEGIKSCRTISNNIKLAEPFSWVTATEIVRNEIKSLDDPKIILIDRDFEYSLERVFCNLYLDREIRAKTLSFYGVETGVDGNILLSKDGANPENFSSKFEQDVLLITNTKERRTFLSNALGLNN